MHWMLAAPGSANPMGPDRSAIDKLGDDWVRAGPDVWGLVYGEDVDFVPPE